MDADAQAAPTSGFDPAPGREWRRRGAGLAEDFGGAVRVWLALRGSTPEEVEALAALFFAELQAARLPLEIAAPRLREAVLASLRAFVAGGESDAPKAETAEAGNEFHRRWADGLTARALADLRAREMQEMGSGAREVLEQLLVGSIRAVDIAALAIVLRREAPAARATVHGLRGAFGEHLRQRVAPAVLAEGDIDGELRELARLCRGEAMPLPLTSAADHLCRACGALLVREGLAACVACLLLAGLQNAIVGEREVSALADAPAAGSRFAGYQLLEEIGRGGMGLIYRARQPGTERIVALKLMQPGLATSREIRERFRREATAAASLDHPGILPVYEVGEKDSLPFFSMKLAEGGSLVEGMGRYKGDPAASASVLALVARAIHHAHERGLLHRDLKPANILIGREGEPLVTDFGLARWIDGPGDLTRSLVVLGTAGYVAPEQAEGSANALTPQADIYSLGVLLFELIAGRRPFLGDNPLTVLRRAGAEPAPRLRSLNSAIPREVDAIVHRCLQPLPADRYPSARALAEDLEGWLRGGVPTHHRVRGAARLRNWMRNQPSSVVGVISLVLLAAGLGAGVLATRRKPELFASKSSREATYFLRRGIDAFITQRDATGCAQAVELIGRAVALDPDFAIAFAELSRVHSQAYWSRIDRSEGRARLALRAAQTAFELAPDLARAPLALGEYYFRCRREDSRALELLRRARDLDNEDIDIHGLIAVVAKRSHRWDEAIAAARKICELQPTRTACLYDLGVTYEVVRRYPEALATFERASYLAPDRLGYIANRGWIRFRASGDLAGLAEFVQKVPSAKLIDPDYLDSALPWYLFTRRLEEAEALLRRLPENFVLSGSTAYQPRAFLLAQVQMARGEDATAELQAAARALEARLLVDREDARAHGTLARVYGLQGRRAEALAEARRASELVPIEREPVDGPERLVDLAEVQLRGAQVEEGVALLRDLLTRPGYITVYELRLDPRWDFTRGDPRFAGLLAGGTDSR